MGHPPPGTLSHRSPSRQALSRLLLPQRGRGCAPGTGQSHRWTLREHSDATPSQTPDHMNTPHLPTARILGAAAHTPRSGFSLDHSRFSLDHSQPPPHRLLAGPTLHLLRHQRPATLPTSPSQTPPLSHAPQTCKAPGLLRPSSSFPAWPFLPGAPPAALQHSHHRPGWSPSPSHPLPVSSPVSAPSTPIHLHPPPSCPHPRQLQVPRRPPGHLSHHPRCPFLRRSSKGALSPAQQPSEAPGHGPSKQLASSAWRLGPAQRCPALLSTSASPTAHILHQLSRQNAISYTCWNASILGALAHSRLCKDHNLLPRPLRHRMDGRLPLRHTQSTALWSLEEGPTLRPL